ncbi:SET domain-containing protein [Hypoxylon cercidicola]|nr:SET domain-containing protein [Hypoxylon cercidicola]
MLRLFLVSQFTLALAYQTHLHQESQTCAVPNLFLIPRIQSCVPSEAPHDGDGNISSKASSPLKAWRPSGFCRGVKAEKFCVFTNPTFNQGEGISVVTTGESMATIAGRPAFFTDEAVTSDLKPTPYREEEFEGKGIGLVATRTIRMGELIMARTPGIMVNEKAIQVLGRKAISELLVRAVNDLPKHHRETLLNLSSHSSAADAGDLIFKILQTNSFRTGYHDGVNPFYSLFAEVSRANHACRPTCAYYFDHTDFFQKVLAVRDITAGEELSIAYYDPLQTHSTRQEKLKKEWGFQCSCERCSANASTIAESDERVVQIQKLWKELDDHSAASTATPERAELLVSLYEREGILGRINEAYYRAAIEYIGIGDIANATKYAKLCAEHGQLFIGPDRPFVKNMQDLIAAPTKYPKWKFRIRDI